MNNMKYETANNPFQASYKDNAHLQKGFNAVILENFVDFILKTIPEATTRPLKILDLCCGDGGVTTGLLNLLQSRGIQVAKIVGYDISAEQIAIAKQYEASHPQLYFQVKNIEEINEDNQYDVVLSLFGLHWIENLTTVSDKISQALKSHGKLMFFVPLEKSKLFALRQQLCSHSPWKERLGNFKLSPFIFNPQDYLKIFNAKFTPFNNDGIVGTEEVIFTKEKFIEFLSSWMQEIRKLNNKELSREYLGTLISMLPTEKGSHDVTLENNDTEKKVLFNERFLWFFGEKISKESEAKKINFAPRFVSKL